MSASTNGVRRPAAGLNVNTLVVVSHVVHYRHRGALYAYGPYSREIDIWADLFPEVVIAAACRAEMPPPDCLAFTRSNISIRPLRETGGHTIAAKLHQLFALPSLVTSLVTTMWQADAVHVRCPGNVGLLGAMLAPLCCDNRIAKYAGQWNGYRGEPWTVRLQRTILRSEWWGSPVTVYGEWPNQPAHVVSFFTSMMTTEQQRRARAIAKRKEFGSPLRVLFMGTLERRKRVNALIDAMKLLSAQGARVELRIVGDGADGAALRAQVHALGIDNLVTFAGALPFDEALRSYEWGDCLVLPSQHSEGWPKVVAEAMSHGLICVAVAHGQIPAMLEGRGIVLPTGSMEEIAATLLEIASTPGAFADRARLGAAWASAHSLESLRNALADLLSAWWGVEQRLPSVEDARLANGQ
jgi:glycosyltransferase involved in cell wall biosynthesis